jgi:hypothetical protein
VALEEWFMKKRCRKSEKATLSQGGFLRKRGCDSQRHVAHYA